MDSLTPEKAEQQKNNRIKLTYMGRVNEKIKGVFLQIRGSARELNAYEVFINQAAADLQAVETLLGLQSNLSFFLEDYKNLVGRHKGLLEDLADMETIILQIRSLQHMDIKLSLVREYIYARCSFYRKDKIAKDIRVLVDIVDNWTKNVEELQLNPAFMHKATALLKSVMEREIKDSIAHFKNRKKVDHLISPANMSPERATAEQVCPPETAAGQSLN